MIHLAIIGEDKIVTFLKELSETEINSISLHCDILNKFDKYTEKFRIFKNSYFDLKNLLQTDDPENKNTRLILELMSAFRALLDHWETELKRKFGKQSKEVGIFKSVTNNEYDEKFSYRFISGLRNYIQHVSMPSIRSNSTINENNLIETKLYLSKKELIETFDDWKPKVLEDFIMQPDSIELLPILDEVFDSIKQINDIAINLFNIKELVLSSQELLRLKKMQGNIKGDLVIIKSDENLSIKIQILPIHIAEYVINNTILIKK